MKTGTALEEPAVRRYLGAVRPIVAAMEKVAAFLKRESGAAFHYADYAVDEREVRLNRILGDLLDPHGPHGQGGRFLELFLKTVSTEIPIGNGWYSVPNFPTLKGRYIDLVLRHDRVVVGIELKPWAREGEQQLEDYANDLRYLGEHWLVFVPGKGDTKDESLTEETKRELGTRFVTLPIERSRSNSGGRSVIEWLERCAAACRADNVRSFLLDLADYLDERFPSPDAMAKMTQTTNAEAIVEMTKVDAENIRCAFMVEQAVPQLRLTIAREFVRNVIRELEREAPEGWIVDRTNFRDFSEGQEYFFYRKRSWPETWGGCLEKWSAPMSGFSIGFSCPSEGQDAGPCASLSDRLAIKAAVEGPVRAVAERVNVNATWWPAFTPLREPFANWTEAQTFVLLAGHERCSDGRWARDVFVGWFKAIAQAAEPIIDKISRIGVTLTQLRRIRALLRT